MLPCLFIIIGSNTLEKGNLFFIGAEFLQFRKKVVIGFFCLVSFPTFTRTMIIEVFTVPSGRCTACLEERERKIVAEFVKNGAIIVSGLAFGCDSISHQQALDSCGKTIAILPSPLNNILPARNKGLAFQIVEQGGLLVTEYGNDFKSQMELSSRYKERDRLQALFCDTIVLAASYAQNSAERWKLFGQKLDSGARLAMGYAKEYDIARAVMYDKTLDEDNPMFDLNRDIINEKKEVTVITQDKLFEIISKIIRKTPIAQNTTTVQTNLFG